MVRCRCGRWTNYGLTCSSCRIDTYGYTEEGEPVEKKEEVVEVDDDDEDED